METGTRIDSPKSWFCSFAKMRAAAEVSLAALCTGGEEPLRIPRGVTSPYSQSLSQSHNLGFHTCLPQQLGVHLLHSQVETGQRWEDNNECGAGLWWGWWGSGSAGNTAPLDWKGKSKHRGSHSNEVWITGGIWPFVQPTSVDQRIPLH